MKRSHRYLLSLSIVVILVFLGYRFATRMSASGRVTDGAGNPIANAKVEVVVVEGREAKIPDEGTFLTLSDAAGRYTIVVANGKGRRYKVSVSKDGFEPKCSRSVVSAMRVFSPILKNYRMYLIATCLSYIS